MRLLRLYPKIAARPCDECRVWWFDERTGEVATRGGKPLPRPKGAKPPCGACPKVPHATPNAGPEHAVELTPELLRAYEFHEECRAVGEFPGDPIVRWCARHFRAAREHCDKVQTHRTQLAVISAVRDS